jgi:hypothetical protein
MFAWRERREERKRRGHIKIVSIVRTKVTIPVMARVRSPQCGDAIRAMPLCLGG